MNEHRYLIKIIPPTGLAVYKLEFGLRHVAAVLALAIVILAGAAGVHAYQLHDASAHVNQLQALTASQHEKLNLIDAEAEHLAGEIQRLERQNMEIRRAMGMQNGRRQATREARPLEHRDALTVATVETDLARVARASDRARSETVALRRLAARILNIRHVESLARAELLAAVPSLVPAGSGAVASSFGYRASPWPEFHQGLDLEADYGAMVRAAATGTVASAGWDGGFGQKVDIDHGNGLHTWYAHLSRIEVRVGQRVLKGTPIAAVGSTGSSTGAHLHYQVMRGATPIDPAPFLKGEGAKVIGLETSAKPAR